MMMTLAGKDLWPASFEQVRDASPVAEEAKERPEEDIIILGRRMDLQVNAEDIDELLEEHREELTTEELENLQQEQRGTS